MIKIQVVFSEDGRLERVKYKEEEGVRVVEIKDGSTEEEKKAIADAKELLGDFERRRL